VATTTTIQLVTDEFADHFEGIETQGVSEPSPIITATRAEADSAAKSTSGEVTIMETTIEWQPVVTGLDQFDQSVELARLSDFARRVSTPEAREYVNNNLVCANEAAWDDVHTKFTNYVIGSTILKLIDADLLRFGTLIGDGDLKQAFGIVQRSDNALDYIQRRILPLDYIAGCLLFLVATGCVCVEMKEHRGVTDFVFCRACDQIAMAMHLIEQLPSEHDLEADPQWD
jgi:hypothetical protein